MDQEAPFAAVADSTWLIALIAAVVLFVIWKCSSGTPPAPPAPKREPLRVRDYTRAELRGFDGQQTEGEKTILIGVLGKVYDVTPSADFYGPQGAYGLFAGQDATMVLARDSTSEKDLEDTTPLTDAEWERAREWEMFFSGKYHYAGRLTDPRHPAAAEKLDKIEEEVKAARAARVQQSSNQ